MTKYGYNTIGVMVLISSLLIVISILASNQPLKIALVSFAILLIVFTLNFFRDPERTAPSDPSVLISPADGKIIVIKEVEEKEYLKSTGTQISVFMSPLNVHVNRIPINGKVEYIKYVEGEYIAAFEDKASERNERSQIGIMSTYGKVFFTQIAGFVARRIIYDLKPQQNVIAGERFGMIKFGSRVDVIVPKGWVPAVKIGDKVSAGETVLFRRGE